MQKQKTEFLLSWRWQLSFLIVGSIGSIWSPVLFLFAVAGFGALVGYVLYRKTKNPAISAISIPISMMLVIGVILFFAGQDLLNAISKNPISFAFIGIAWSTFIIAAGVLAHKRYKYFKQLGL